MKRKGFTLIELIFVIVILGILSAVALPRFGNVSDQAKKSKEVSDASAIKTGIQNARAIALMEGNTTNDDIVYIDGTGVTVATGGYPQHLSTLDGAAYTGTGDANFSSVLEDSPANWEFTTTNKEYKSPIGNIYTYDEATGKFTCADGTDVVCP